MTDSTLRYMVGGVLLTEAELRARAKALPKERKPRESTPSHRGWRVVGHQYDAMLDAERDARAAFAKGESTTPWSESNWRRNTKKLPVSRPFEVYAAALLCADLAQQSGWIDVEIIELKKGA